MLLYAQEVGWAAKHASWAHTLAHWPMAPTGRMPKSLLHIMRQLVNLLPDPEGHANRADGSEVAVNLMNLVVGHHALVEKMSFPRKLLHALDNSGTVATNSHNYRIILALPRAIHTVIL